MHTDKLNRKYAALVNEIVGERGYCGGAMNTPVKMAVQLASVCITGRWPGTPICNRNAGAELRAVAAELIEEAERVESYNRRAA